MKMDVHKYRNVQTMAKTVLSELSKTITAESTELSIAETAIELMSNKGITDTWYYDAPAFVLLGSRSCLSISGRDYIPAVEKVGSTNLVSVDLSPLVDDIWGDYSRSFPIENGTYAEIPMSKEFQLGLNMENKLHIEMKEFVTPETKLSDLYHFGNQLISEFGFENIDFLSNLGHSIETDKSNRKYIDRNCHDRFGSLNLFTFEPHIKLLSGVWGFKHENIYYFDSSGIVQEL